MARHGSLAEQLEAFRRYVTTPDHDPEPVQTNWATVPANDNNPEDIEGMRLERRWRMKPSIEEIMRSVRADDVERNDAGQIVRIGRLRFSDGTQTEQAFKLTIDGKVVPFQARMPVGAMLGTKDAAESQLGGEEDSAHVTASNRYFADMLDTLPPRYKAGGKRKRGAASNHEEAKRELAEAYANTDMSKVTFTRYPDGLPCGSARVADSFLGMQKGKKGESGSMMWQDIVSARLDRDMWAATVDSLMHSDKRVLDAAASAKSMRQVGESLGFSGKNAERRGKRALIAANDNLMSAIEAYAA
ncbi:hypothetical protein CN093_08800 [Sinorhizobium meliloti]|uniref:hypothetical protein n=1 Tax=Rhizobium meliloti TaxID=382 RepID=UPI000FD2FFE6|nr:hypothetical protein [Sinorhizobium meliloti]RVO41352.1 hypothetical protein CN093_08800 [Sinorhizobium meliloti]